MGVASKVAGVAKSVGKKAANVGKRAAVAGKGMYDAKRAGGAGAVRSALEAAKFGAKEGAGAVGRLGPRGQAGLAGMGVGGALAALGMMSGGDEAEMAEMAERSGLPLGGNSMASMRMAMLPSIQKKISSEVLSGRDPSRILSRIERDIYEPLARQTNEMGEGEADDLYNLTEGMARVLYADAPEQDKLAALYELAGME